MLDGLLDAVKMLPFLFGVYILIEYMEHKNSNGFEGFFKRLGIFGPVGGAVLGTVPQCGISVAATNLFSGRVITLGTIIAVYIATSDEAIPIILANPDKIGVLWKLIVIKVIAAAASGIAVDLITKAVFKNKKEEKPFEELCEHCGCHDHHGGEGHSVLLPALKHTVEIFIFVLIINIALGFVMEYLGQDFLESILISDSPFQPFVCAIVGFIPNCAASVLLTELYLEGVITFGSCIAGLCTGAGMGLLVLFKTNKRHMKQNFAVLGILYVCAVLTGFATNLLF